MKLPNQAQPVLRQAGSVNGSRRDAGIAASGHWYCSALGTACNLVPQLRPFCSRIVSCCNNI